MLDVVFDRPIHIERNEEMSLVMQSRAPRVWSYEACDSGWRLIARGYAGWKYEHGPLPLGGLRACTQGCAVAQSQVASLITVLRHVMEHRGLMPPRGAHSQAGWTIRTGLAEPGADPECGPKMTVLEGPVMITPDAAVGDGWELCQSVEFEWRHTPSLLAALLDVVPSILPTGIGGENCRLCGCSGAGGCDWCSALAGARIRT